MAPPEPSGPTIARHEHANTDEAEENDLKNNFMKMIEALKEEMKISLKEMEEKTKRKFLEEIKKTGPTLLLHTRNTPQSQTLPQMDITSKKGLGNFFSNQVDLRNKLV